MIQERTYVDAILESLHAAERHLPTEYADDLEATLGSVTPTAPTCERSEPEVGAISWTREEFTDDLCEVTS